MENTLLIGDFLFVNKALYGAEVPIIRSRLPAVREPERNDILVFDSVEEEGLKVVKRLIGMPGDTLFMEEGELYRNGPRVAEPYAVHADPSASEDPIQRAKMREWQLPHLVAAGQRQLSARSPGLGADRGAGRFVLHDGRQPGQLLRRALLGIPAAAERAGTAAGRVLQLRRRTAGARCRSSPRCAGAGSSPRRSERRRVTRCGGAALRAATTARVRGI